MNPQEVTVDLIFGARIRTFEQPNATTEALAIGKGRVLASGRTADLQQAFPTARPVRLDGGCLMPGFCDTHMHLEKIAGELAMVQLDGADSIAEVLRRVEAKAATLQPGEWCRSFGDDNAWHEARLRERRPPNRQELDAAAPHNPVFLYRGPDTAALNSLALEALRDQLDNATGWDESKGILQSPTARELESELPASVDKDRLLAAAATQLLGYGITTVVDPGLPAAFADSWELYARVRAAGSLPIRTWLMDRFDHRRPFDEELERVLTRELSPFSGDDQLHGFGLKLILDGEFDNAWMGGGEPQPAPPAIRYSELELGRVVDLCAERSWPLCIHVMGSQAFDAVLAALRAARERGRRLEPGQLTLAHAFHVTASSAEGARLLGISISVQPLLAYVFEREMDAAWGNLAQRANPYRMLLDAGVPLAGGSDVLPCEPLRGAAYAVNRRAREGTTLGTDQALSPEEALSLFTAAAGTYLRRPGHGTLAVGAPADFAWWPEDPIDHSPDHWPHLTPNLVAVGGSAVWGALDMLASPKTKEQP